MDMRVWAVFSPLLTARYLAELNTMGYIVEMLVTWDESKEKSNLAKHGIDFDEAKTVLFAPLSVTLEDRRHGEDRFVTIAFSKKLNLLVVVYAYQLEEEIRIISARKATKKEAKLYEERV